MLPLFHVFLIKSLSKCPSSTNLPCALPSFTLKNRDDYFYKTEYVSVSVTALTNFLLHQIDSEFGHIQRSVFLRYMLAYSITFSVTEALSHILRHFEGIFRLIQAYSALYVTHIFTALPFFEF